MLTASILLLLLGFHLLILASASEVICYICYSNSTTTGKYCSIDSLCTGASCYFAVESSGQWEAGCSSTPASTPDLHCSLDGLRSSCSCSGDFCNDIDDVNTTLRTFWGSDPPFNNIQLMLPTLDVVCMECGNLTIGGVHKDIDCDEKHLCRGSFCVTKRGKTPHSYCGTDWEGSGETRCFKNPGEEEQCVCPQQMCNAVLPPEVIQTTVTAAQPPSPTLPITASPIPTVQVNTPATPNPAESPECDLAKFSPNAQAVYMGEKLKQIISGDFAKTGSEAFKQFEIGINNHICNYSPKEK